MVVGGGRGVTVHTMFKVTFFFFFRKIIDTFQGYCDAFPLQE